MGEEYMISLPWGIQATLGDALTVIGLVGGLIGLVLVLIQLIASNRQARLTATAQRGRFVLDVINHYLDDQEMFRLHSLLEHFTFAYVPDPQLDPQDDLAISRAISRTF